MERVLEEGVEQELAIPGRFRHHRSPRHQAHRQPHRGGCEEFPLRAKAQEENMDYSVPKPRGKAGAVEQ